MDDKKQKLIVALKEERARFEKFGYNITEHDVAIEYLETGFTYEDPDDFELLDAVINYYDTLCSDYCV